MKGLIRLVLIVGLTSLLFSCTLLRQWELQDATAKKQLDWQGRGVSNYSYQITIRRGTVYYSYLVLVQNSQPKSYSQLSPSTAVSLESEYQTIDRVFDQTETLLGQGFETASVAFDALYDYPVMFYLDKSASASGDETYLTLEKLSAY